MIAETIPRNNQKTAVMLMYVLPETVTVSHMNRAMIDMMSISREKTVVVIAICLKFLRETVSSEALALSP